MSWVIYSRKPKDKALWANSFRPYMDTQNLEDAIDIIQILYIRQKQFNVKPVMVKDIQKDKERWTPYAKANRCIDCNAIGYKFIPTNELAGLKFKPPICKVGISKWIYNKQN